MVVKPRKYKSVSQMVEAVCDDKEFVDSLKERLSRRRIVKTLAAQRAARGLSQGDIAKKLRCTQSRISKLENGYDDDLRVGELKDYSDRLGLELQLALLPKNFKATDKVKLHALAIRGLLDEMVKHAHVDQDIATAVAGFFGEAFFHLLRIVKDSSDKLPPRDDGGKYIEIQVYDSEMLRDPSATPTREREAIEDTDPDSARRTEGQTRVS